MPSADDHPEPDRGDLADPTPPILRWMYRRGIFPMADPLTDTLDWYSPDPRGIIPLESPRIPRSVRRVMRQGRFEIRSDTAFETVMRGCARPRTTGDETWIDERMIGAYVALHEEGDAHSIEAWRGGRLVGGLYGVHLAGAFFGESMFVRPELGGRDASKVCLVHLVRHLRRRGFALLDTQFVTPHLQRFGAVEISRGEYLGRLAAALAAEVAWVPFDASPT